MSMSSPYSISSQELCFISFAAFRVENSSGRGFDPLLAGPNATNVPKEAIVVDSSSPDIVFSNASQWDNLNGVHYYRRSLWYASEAGASLDFSFNGVAIWYACVYHTYSVRANLFLRYYSDINTNHGLYTISIDGSIPEQMNGNSKGHRTQQMLWSKTDLTPGNHTFTLRQYDISGKSTSLDFFRSVISETTE